MNRAIIWLSLLVLIVSFLSVAAIAVSMPSSFWNRSTPWFEKEDFGGTMGTLKPILSPFGRSGE